MGNNPGTQFSDESLRSFEKQFQFVKEINDERWGVAQVWKDRSVLSHVMIVSKSFHSDPEYKDFLNHVHLRCEHPQENLLRFLGWSTTNQDGLCGHNRKCDLYLQYLSQNLNKEVTRRIEKREPFDESELWYLARTTIATGAYLQSRGLYHGDYRPSQILLDDENNQGSIRLTDNGLIGLYRNNYILTLSGAARGYLSPELIAAYSRREANPAYDVYRSDVYSLGMTLLQCASLKEPEKYYYDWAIPSIAHKAIRKALDDLRLQYSPQFVDLLATMLDENEHTRPNFLALNVTPAQPIYQPQPQVVIPQPQVVIPQPQPQVVIPQPQPQVVIPQPPPQVVLPQRQPEFVLPQRQPEFVLPPRQPEYIQPQVLPPRQPDFILPQPQSLPQPQVVRQQDFVLPPRQSEIIYSQHQPEAFLPSVQSQVSFPQPQPQLFQPQPQVIQPQVQPQFNRVLPQSIPPVQTLPQVQSFPQNFSQFQTLPQASPAPTNFVSSSFGGQNLGFSGIRYVPQASPVKSFYPQTQTQGVSSISSGLTPVSQPTTTKASDLTDLDRRVQAAIKATEETINRNSQA